ncbi:MAG: hypothetical protein ABII27_01305 [bacterium]
MKELILFLSQFPIFILLILLLMELGLAFLFIQFIIEDKPSKKAVKPGGNMKRMANEEFNTLFKIVENRLNDLASRCDMHEKKLLQLESMVCTKGTATPVLLENKVNELQKLVYSVVEKIKEYQ